MFTVDVKQQYNTIQYNSVQSSMPISYTSRNILYAMLYFNFRKRSIPAQFTHHQIKIGSAFFLISNSEIKFQNPSIHVSSVIRPYYKLKLHKKVYNSANNECNGVTDISTTNSILKSSSLGLVIQKLENAKDKEGT